MIQNLKDLERLLKLCRKQGVTEIDLGVVKMKLGELPRNEVGASANQDQNEVESDNPYSNFPDGMLTSEQLMYYSAGGHPDTDPYRDANSEAEKQ